MERAELTALMLPELCVHDEVIQWEMGYGAIVSRVSRCDGEMTHRAAA